MISLVPQVKLGMPLLPADFVERSELLAELDAAAAAGATTLVCAPPGYGKTLLLTDWATRPPPVETAWVTIDGGDNDPRRLWASVLAALAGHTSLQASTLSIIRQSSLPWSTAEHTEFVAELVDDLHFLPNPIRLILDDVDELTDPEALRGLQILAGNVPTPGPSRAVQQVRSAARAEPAAAVWPAPRDPGRPPALHVGRIGDPVGEGRSALDGAPGAAAPPTHQRLGGRAAAGRTRPHRRARPGQIRRRILQRRALRRRLPHRRDPEPSASRHAGVSAGHQHSGSHLAASWRWHCRAAPTRAPCSTRSSTTRPCCRPSIGSATPTVCSRSCAPISLPTCDATSDIVLGWLEHRSRPSRRHPPASDEPPTCQRTIIYDTHGPITADAVNRSEFGPAEEKER